jgi:nucleotide sugar dehydrogenase
MPIASLDDLENFVDPRPTIGVIGAGRLGICFAILADRAGYKVIVSDVRKDYIKNLQEKKISTNEPLVPELLEQSDIKATTSNEEVIKESDIIYTFVATPSLKDGSYDVSAVQKVVDDILDTPLVFTDRKTFVVGCTTNPGDCDKFAEQLPGMKVYYNPEFIAQGAIIRGLLRADMVLVGGEYDKNIADLYYRIQGPEMEPKMNFMSLTAAELTKIALNCYLTMKISYANQVGEVLTKFGLEDEIGKVLNAIGEDSRVGSKYLGYGFGYGGPCLPRDNRAFAHAAERVGLKNNIGLTIDAFNDEHSDFLADTLCEKHKNKKVPFYFPNGITYKKGTDIIEESQQYKLFKELLTRGYKVTVMELPEVVERLYDDLVFTWPGQFKFIYTEEHIPHDYYKVNF